ncbi:single-stranded DNA-binding protein [Thiothrix subterranea]|uniref:Single-stranded DNA-binding protein n=1 Tax=Thiothrix subterranea TaxID=2735563 RepID=A0AA51MKG7_9GAMM|nr:single-stranded DNA-binding protein [Thiothrix subterranea]MDQ5770889.1 single-stranded DNA-binding protein [Thiothrix subterranea]WML86082.1 single-stranded DNA-binding protein [Thiothrix subterranea]
MANGINKVILVGTVGRDPEMKYMPSGDAIANISVATSESWKDKNTGEKKEATEWHNVTFYRGLAKVVGDYVRKGQLLYVEGSLKTRSWEKDGQKHYRTEVNATDMKMLGGRPGGGMGSGNYDDSSASPAQRSSNHGGGYGGGAPSAPADNASSRGFEDFDDDIPF